MCYDRPARIHGEFIRTCRAYMYPQQRNEASNPSVADVNQAAPAQFRCQHRHVTFFLFFNDTCLNNFVIQLQKY